MHRRALALAGTFVVTAAAIAAQATDIDQDALRKDLTPVIALQGLPCGVVVAVTVRAENDYAASCKDGNRYRVFLNPTGRVVVELQK